MQGAAGEGDGSTLSAASSSAAAPVPAAAAAESAALPPDTDEGGPGEPPPVYATRLPEPAQLRYALSYNGQAGEAVLTWRHDGQHYSLSLEGGGAVRPLVVDVDVTPLSAVVVVLT